MGDGPMQENVATDSRARESGAPLTAEQLDALATTVAVFEGALREVYPSTSRAGVTLETLRLAEQALARLRWVLARRGAI
jgi:hypothetical protein